MTEPSMFDSSGGASQAAWGQLLPLAQMLRGLRENNAFVQSAKLDVPYQSGMTLGQMIPPNWQDNPMLYAFAPGTVLPFKGFPRSGARLPDGMTELPNAMSGIPKGQTRDIISPGGLTDQELIEMGLIGSTPGKRPGNFISPVGPRWSANLPIVATGVNYPFIEPPGLNTPAPAQPQQPAQSQQQPMPQGWLEMLLKALGQTQGGF